MTPEIAEQLKACLDDPEWTPEKLKKVDRFAAALCALVRAMMAMNAVSQSLAPMRSSLQAGEKELKQRIEELEANKMRLAETMAQLATDTASAGPLPHVERPPPFGDLLPGVGSAVAGELEYNPLVGM